jgi:hypothetical protein
MRSLVTDNPPIDANNLVMAKTMADKLHRCYPGHLWAVSVDKGLASVRNLALSGQWGFVIKLSPIYSATYFDKLIMRAGGELLERYRVNRGLAHPEELAYLPTDFAGQHRHDT